MVVTLVIMLEEAADTMIKLHGAGLHEKAENRTLAYQQR